jgi:hypothetical protein
MFLRHPLDHEFAGHGSLTPFYLAYDPEGVATHGQHRCPSLQEIAFLEPQRPTRRHLGRTEIKSALMERTPQEARASE